MREQDEASTSCRYEPEPKDATLGERELLWWMLGSMTVGLGAFCAVLISGGTPPETAAEAFEEFAPWLVFAIAATLALKVLLDHTAKAAADPGAKAQAQGYESTKRWSKPRQEVALAGLAMGYSLGALAYLATMGLAVVAATLLLLALVARLVVWIFEDDVRPSRVARVLITAVAVGVTILLATVAFPWLDENRPDIGPEESEQRYTCSRAVDAGADPTFTCVEQPE